MVRVVMLTSSLLSVSTSPGLDAKFSDDGKKLLSKGQGGDVTQT